MLEDGGNVSVVFILFAQLVVVIFWIPMFLHTSDRV